MFRLMAKNQQCVSINQTQTCIWLSTLIVWQYCAHTHNQTYTHGCHRQSVSLKVFLIKTLGLLLRMVPFKMTLWRHRRSPDAVTQPVNMHSLLHTHPPHIQTNRPSRKDIYSDSHSHSHTTDFGTCSSYVLSVTRRNLIITSVTNFRFWQFGKRMCAQMYAKGAEGHGSLARRGPTWDWHWLKRCTN